GHARAVNNFAGRPAGRWSPAIRAEVVQCGPAPPARAGAGRLSILAFEWRTWLWPRPSALHPPRAGRRPALPSSDVPRPGAPYSRAGEPLLPRAFGLCAGGGGDTARI